MSNSIITNNSESLREELNKRNLYSPELQYPLDDPNSVTKIVNTVSSIISTIAPFKGTPISDTILGRLVSEKTPITEIGLVMLAKQLAYTSKDNLISKYMPKFNPTAIFDKNEKMFEMKEDYSLTKKHQTLFGKAIDAVTNFTSNKYDEKHGAVYLNSSKNIDGISFNNDINFNNIINNTGTAQLELMIKNVGRNKYVSSALYTNSITNKIIYKDSDFQNYNFDFIEYNDSAYKSLVENTRPLPNDFIWGIDSEVVTSKVGLMKYTNDLLLNKFNNFESYNIDGSGFYKESIDGKKIESWNGSALTTVPDNALDGAFNLMRQHSAKSPYGSFIKAIRFDGNKVYGGNQNSVIYNSVIPKIHPTKQKLGSFDSSYNKNLMFSIENLAVKVISEGQGYGIIDDDKLTQIPVSEVGAFNGRLMWFPPYNIRFNETTSAKYDETMMVGRGEPVYSYMNTTRTGTLNFSLLIDYPPQLKNKRFTDSKSIAEFFAFGIKDVNVVNITNDNIGISEEYEDLTKKLIDDVDDLSMNGDIAISFPNDFPNESQINNAFNLMIEIPYEAGTNMYQDFGLNANIYNIKEYTYGTVNNMNVKTGVVGSLLGQYEYDSNSNNIIDSNLRKFYDNPSNRGYYDIYISSGASKLFTTEYNKKLSERRAKAIELLIKMRLESIYGVNFSDLGINIIKEYFGESLASANKGAEGINDIDTKKDRFGTVYIQRNKKQLELVTKTDLTDDEKRKASSLEEKLVTNSQTIKNINETSYDTRLEMTFNDITKDSDTSSLNSFTDDTFRPVFHSQTPEEFHRRLTFLQQCLRQGKSIDKGIKNSAFGAQPVCILRVGDHIYSKVIIHNLNIEYEENMWDMNPEGWGMQPMLAHVTLQLYILGGQSLEGPIDALQNAISFNYYANSTFGKTGMYVTASNESEKQSKYMENILSAEKNKISNNIKSTTEEVNKNKNAK